MTAHAGPAALREALVAALQEAGEAEAAAYLGDARPVVGTWGDRILTAFANQGINVSLAALPAPDLAPVREALRTALGGWEGLPAFDGPDGFSPSVMAAEQMAAAIRAALAVRSAPSASGCSDPEHPGGAFCIDTTGLSTCYAPEDMRPAPSGDADAAWADGYWPVLTDIRGHDEAAGTLPRWGNRPVGRAANEAEHDRRWLLTIIEAALRAVAPSDGAWDEASLSYVGGPSDGAGGLDVDEASVWYRRGWQAGHLAGLEAAEYERTHFEPTS